MILSVGNPPSGYCSSWCFIPYLRNLFLSYIGSFNLTTSVIFTLLKYL